MARRINSSLVFALLVKAYKMSDGKIYDLLLYRTDVMENNHTTNGPRFKNGLNASKKACFWPSESWGNMFFQFENSAECCPEYKKACQLYRCELQRTLPTELGLTTGLGVWCYNVLLEAYTKGVYENSPTHAKIDITSVCRDYGISKARLNYYIKYTVSLEHVLQDILKECENSSSQSLEESDGESFIALALHDIRAFLEGLSTENGIIFKKFKTNEEFVRCLLPQKCIDDFSSLGIPQSVLYDVIAEHSYDDEYETAICDKLANDDGFRIRLIAEKSQRLLNDVVSAEELYKGSLEVLTSYISNTRTKDLFVSCIRRCSNGNYPYRGFSVIVLMALLGERQFKRLFPSTTHAHNTIR